MAPLAGNDGDFVFQVHGPRPIRLTEMILPDAPAGKVLPGGPGRCEGCGKADCRACPPMICPKCGAAAAATLCRPTRKLMTDASA